jgi:hypothetical protein
MMGVLAKQENEQTREIKQVRIYNLHSQLYSSVHVVIYMCNKACWINVANEGCIYLLVWYIRNRMHSPTINEKYI